MTKKILFVWERISPVTSYLLKPSTNQVLGGGEVSLINLAKTLKQSATSLDLFVIYHSMVTLEDFNQIFYTENNYVPGWLKRLQLLIKTLIQLGGIINNYDTVIVNDEPLLSMVMLALKPFCRAKLIFWSHLSKTYFQQNARKVSQLANCLALRYCANTVICVSNHAKEKMVEFLGNRFIGKVRVIYNVVYKNQATTSLPRHFDNGYEVLSVSRLTKEKGVDVFINAINLIVNKYNIKNLHFTICGDGDEYQNLLDLLNQYKLVDYVSLVGYVANPVPYYQLCDIFVLSSHTEALPLVVVEALLHGKPVISTNTGAAEVLDNGTCGFIINCGDVVALADAIIKVINDSTFRDSLIANTDVCLARFKHDKILAQWLEVL